MCTDLLVLSPSTEVDLQALGPVDGLSRVPSPALSLHSVPIPSPLSGGGPWHASGEVWPTPSSWLYCLQPQPLFQGAPPSMLWEKPSLCWAPTPADPKHTLEKPQLMLASAQPSHQSHWAHTVCIGMFLYKYMHSRLGQINYFTKLIETESQTK